MRLTLQDMVSSVLGEAAAREKLAQAEESKAEKEKEPASAPPFPKKEEKKDEEKEKESAGLKCASVETSLVEKVASALDYINGNMNQIDWEKVAVGEGLGTQAANAPAPQVGPATGPGSDLATNMDSPTPGLQSTNTGQATPQSQPPERPGSDRVSNKDGQTNPATALETDMANVPGGTGLQPQLQEGGSLPNMKKASVQSIREMWALRKTAADAENPASFSAGTTPLENPDASASEENVPKHPPAAQAQANLVQTKDPTKPADITKQQAKAEPKRQMGEVLDEPAQKKSTDPVLHENLDAAGQAGVKLSSSKAARAFLRKIAQAGESPDATPEEKEKARKLKEAIEAKKKGDGGDKEKESQFGTAGGAPVPPTPPPVTPVA